MKKVISLSIVFIIAFTFGLSNSNAQYTNEIKPNSRNLSPMQSPERGFSKGHLLRQTSRPKVQVRTLIGDLFRDTIQNHFHNKGFTTYETIQDGFMKHTPPWPEKIDKYFYFPVGDIYRSNSTPLPNIARLILPEVMQEPEVPEEEKPHFNPFNADPSLIPPHLLAPEVIPSDATDAIYKPLPIVKDSPEIFETTPVLKNFPVLQRPKPEIKNATLPLQQTFYSDNQMIFPQMRVPLPTRQTILTEEQRVFKRGLDAFKYRNYIKARQTFSELVQINPDSAQAQFGYGLSLFYTGEYETSLQVLGNSYRIAKQNGAPEPTVWDLNIDPNDFRYYHKKLNRYVNEHPSNKTTGTLLFLLTHAGVMPKSPAKR